VSGCKVNTQFLFTHSHSTWRSLVSATVLCSLMGLEEREREGALL